MSYPPEPPPWQEAQVELATVIGEVTLSMTAIEDSLDELILDLLVQPPMFSFFKRRFLGRWMVGAKIELLIVRVEEWDSAVANAPTALGILREMKAANEERNRLVHDLHLVDDDGGVSRRRLWEEDGAPVDRAVYQELVNRLDVLSGDELELLQDALGIAPINLIQP